MSLYGTNEDYTLGWDDCESELVLPLEAQIASLNEVITLLKEKEGTKYLREETGDTAIKS